MIAPLQRGVTLMDGSHKQIAWVQFDPILENVLP
jgi:hypothetical protein